MDPGSVSGGHLKMLIKSIKAQAVNLPFRFSFGHALAARRESVNVVVRVELLVGDRVLVGFGESVPRLYVTGETAQSALAAINYRFAPALEGQFFKEAGLLLRRLRALFIEEGLETSPQGAAFCAMELAVLDALGQAVNLPLSCMPLLISKGVTAVGSENSTKHQLWQLQDRAEYGAVVPFGRREILALMLEFYKKYGFKTVKLKVGGSLNEDVAKVKMARKIMGEKAVIRVDANCAWTYDQACYSLAALRPFGIASCEQPLPADDLDGFARLVRAVPEVLVADESLTTIASAKNLIDAGCRAFNVRLSKVGGLIASVALIELAADHDVECHLGAQVGESGILAAAQRHLALAYPYFANVEGAMNLFLLKGDLVRESMTVPPGASCALITRAGNGVTVNARSLQPLHKVRSTSGVRNS